MASIECFSLTKRYDHLLAVEDLNLSIEKGETLALLGPNGAGKTTTLRMLAGTIFPSSGYSLIEGLDPVEEPDQVRERIGFLPEASGFYSRLSAQENLLFFARFYPIDNKRQVEKYLKVTGLYPKRNDSVGSYSQGMKQRLALARSLLHEPQVILLDEPTSGLDPEAQRNIHDLIRQFQVEGRTILLSTHNLEEAESLSSKIALLRTSLVASGKPDELRKRLFERKLIIELETLDERAIQDMRNLPIVQELDIEGNKLYITLKDFDHDRPLLVEFLVNRGEKILTVSEERHPLTDIYFKLLEDQ